ncbi:MAG: hypothetical protein SGJ18_05655 [Pseudomonadota bacterium]|nr:hypothetical protein [Pseudomonadota bacterium]
MKLKMTVQERGGTNRSFPVDGPTVVLSVTGTIVDVDACVLATAVAEMCTALGGTMSGANCTLPTVPPFVPMYQCIFGGGSCSTCRGQVSTTPISCIYGRDSSGQGTGSFCSGPTISCPRIN